MIRTAIVATAVALLMSATAALSHHAARVDAQQEPSVAVAIDLDTTGNTASAVGAEDACRTANQGDTFQLDIVVKGVPPLASDGSSGATAGYELNFHYNPQVINVSAVDDKLMIQTQSAFELIRANYGSGSDALPSTNGDLAIVYLNLGNTYQSGDGVLARLTVQVIGTGQSSLTVDDEIGQFSYPSVYNTNQSEYGISSLQPAVIEVGQPCGSPPTPTNAAEVSQAPTTSPSATSEASVTPTGSPTPVASVLPVGNTQLAVDAVITGNQATSLGQTDACASADKGETFQLDVVIKGVNDLLAWQVPVSFDPKILRVDDRDVKLFQASNTGSQVYDASQQTPNDTGLYVAQAVDTADPPAPDSGDGVLVRLTMTAIATGTSKVAINAVDINGDNTADQGILLRAENAAIIGDTNGDTFFDGLTTPTEIRVGAVCPGGERVVPTQAGSATGGGGGGSNTWVWIAVGVGGGAIVVAGAAFGAVAMRRRRRGAPSP